MAYSKPARLPSSTRRPLSASEAELPNIPQLDTDTKTEFDSELSSLSFEQQGFAESTSSSDNDAHAGEISHRSFRTARPQSAFEQQMQLRSMIADNASTMLPEPLRDWLAREDDPWTPIKVQNDQTSLQHANELAVSLFNVDTMPPCVTSATSSRQPVIREDMGAYVGAQFADVSCESAASLPSVRSKASPALANVVTLQDRSLGDSGLANGEWSMRGGPELCSDTTAVG